MNLKTYDKIKINLRKLALAGTLYAQRIANKLLNEEDFTIAVMPNMMALSMSDEEMWAIHYLEMSNKEEPYCGKDCKSKHSGDRYCENCGWAEQFKDEIL